MRSTARIGAAMSCPPSWHGGRAACRRSGRRRRRWKRRRGSRRQAGKDPAPAMPAAEGPAQLHGPGVEDPEDGRRLHPGLQRPGRRGCHGAGDRGPRRDADGRGRGAAGARGDRDRPDAAAAAAAGIGRCRVLLGRKPAEAGREEGSTRTSPRGGSAHRVAGPGPAVGGPRPADPSRTNGSEAAHRDRVGPCTRGGRRSWNRSSGRSNMRGASGSFSGAARRRCGDEWALLCTVHNILKLHTASAHA